MTRCKRLTTLILCLALVLQAVPAAVFGEDGTYLINGRYVSAADYDSTPGQCWVYAQNLYTKIWGDRFTNSFYSEDNILRERTEEELELTAENLRRYVGAAEIGAVLRVTSIDYLYEYSDAVGHSQIIADKDDNGFTVLEGGMAYWPYRFENYYTWDSYVESWYNYNHAYIKYIKWPGDHLYSGSYADTCESFPTYLSFIAKAPAADAEDPGEQPDPEPADQGDTEPPEVPSNQGDIETPEVPANPGGQGEDPGQQGGESGNDPQDPEDPNDPEVPEQPKEPATGFRSQPCRAETDATSEFIALIPEGTVLTATRLFKNTVGEYWYRTSYEGRTGYIFCAEAETGEDISQTILEEVYVTGTMPSEGTVGSPIDLPITVHSDLLEIAAVEGWIEELDGTRILPDFSNSVSVHRRSIYLYNSYVDNTITFGKLPEGTFRFVLSAALLYFYSTDGSSVKTKELTKSFSSEFTMTPPPPPPPEPYCIGDLNGDAQVTADDLTILSRHIAKIEVLALDEAIAAADVNVDGEITADDLTVLSRYVAGIISEL